MEVEERTEIWSPRVLKTMYRIIALDSIGISKNSMICESCKAVNVQRSALEKTCIPRIGSK